MSTRINLYFRSYPDLELIEQNLVLAHTRVFVDIEFAQKDGTWSSFRPAIIDTGSPISLIPLEIWEKCPVQLKGTTTIGGLVRRKECFLTVHIGELSVRFRDRESVTAPFAAMVYLASTNAVPLIIGFESLMKHGDVFLSFAKGEAYMEFPAHN